MLKKRILVLFILIVIFNIFLIIDIKTSNSKKETPIEEIEVVEDKGLDIETRTYYDSLLINNNNILETENYILYFHQDYCGGCLETNEIIDKYISLGYRNVIPIYFVSYNKTPDIFEEYCIEETPTLYYSNDGSAVIYTGISEITEFLDKVVNTANS